MMVLLSSASGTPPVSIPSKNLSRGHFPITQVVNEDIKECWSYKQSLTEAASNLLLVRLQAFDNCPLMTTMNSTQLLIYLRATNSTHDSQGWPLGCYGNLCQKPW